MPRLLAYGGTAFVERQRLGDWPPIPPGVLGDYYGLPVGGAAFGAGVASDSYHLIWRTRRNEQSRGGYPYTLLLDPGRDVWNTFADNAAALLNAVMTEPLLNRRLLDEVEQVTPEWLAAALRSLQPRKMAVNSGDLRLLWVIGATSTSPKVFGGPLPDVDTCDEALAALPRRFRMGGGWLVSGCLPHAEALGVKLVFEPQFGGPPSHEQLQAARGALAQLSSDVVPRRPTPVEAL